MEGRREKVRVRRTYLSLEEQGTKTSREAEALSGSGEGNSEYSLLAR